MWYQLVKSDQFLDDIITNVFARKALGTISKRGNSLFRYCTALHEKGLQPFPIDENDAYEYVVSLSTPSSASSFVESLNFSAGLVGLQGALEAGSSVPIIGAAHRLFLAKRPLLQKVPLTAKQVLQLEEVKK